jgi:hypothetical protein
MDANFDHVTVFRWPNLGGSETQSWLDAPERRQNDFEIKTFFSDLNVYNSIKSSFFFNPSAEVVGLASKYPFPEL